MKPGSKHVRHQAILRAIRGRPVATQSDLVTALRREGIHATQATVSRDIEELGLVKVRAANGAQRYAAPPEPVGANGEARLRRFCQDYPVDGARADAIVVVRSLPGTASALAAAIDACGLAHVVGTVAGDDTVFIATSSGSVARDVLRRLGRFGIVVKEG